MKKRTNETFIRDANRKHDSKYDYSKVNYINNRTKVCIICPVHGEFYQTPNSHLNGCGCPKCGTEESHKKAKKTILEFIKEANKNHNNFYNYANALYVNNKTKISIICPIHGEFEQSPEKHLNGQGCPVCRYIKLSNKLKMSNDDFINKAKRIHGEKYDYSKVKYVSYDEPVIIICPIHGDFSQTPDSHLQGSGCQKCANHLSKMEIELKEILSKYFNDVIVNNRSILNGKELDIYIPSKKIAIEYNGVLWHCEKFGKDKNYHLNKTIECNKKGIRLIHIFEDEYIYRKDVVLHKIKNILNINTDLPKITSEECVFKEVSEIDSSTFLNKFYFQKCTNADVNIGAYCNDILIYIIGINKISKEENKWRIKYFACDYNYIYYDVEINLINHFVKLYKPTVIELCLDRRWYDIKNCEIYQKIGFNFNDYLPPSYKYVKKNSYNRYDENELSVSELKKTDYYKIWDCGLINYIWKT